MSSVLSSLVFIDNVTCESCLSYLEDHTSWGMYFCIFEMETRRRNGSCFVQIECFFRLIPSKNSKVIQERMRFIICIKYWLRGD